MAWSFDEANDDVQITDNPALTLPDGDWTIAGWVKLDDNVGSDFQYFASWGGFDASPSFNWFFTEASHPEPNLLRFLIVDSDGDSTGAISSAGAPGTSTVWQHLILQRLGSSYRQFVDGSSEGATSNALIDDIDLADAFYLGSRSDNNVDRYFGGDMAEWAKWDRALGEDERRALASGFSPLVFPRDLKWYTPMIRPYVELKSGLTITNNGSIIGPHPAIIYPSGLLTPYRVAEAAPEVPDEFGAAAGEAMGAMHIQRARVVSY